jgi:uncharacterized protein DUF6457
MTAEEWIARFAERLGVEPPTEEEIAALLDLASAAAHSSERKAAPIACWLAANSGMAPDAARALADEIS